MFGDGWLTNRKHTNSTTDASLRRQFKPGVLISDCFRRSFFQRDIMDDSSSRKAFFNARFHDTSDLSAASHTFQERSTSGGDVAAFMAHTSSGFLTSFVESSQQMALYSTGVPFDMAVVPSVEATAENMYVILCYFIML
jgi:hypothetical protein